MIPGIIVAHGRLAEAVLGAVQTMYGTVADLYALSNEGFSTNELAGGIREIAETADGEGVCVFVDAFGGSCWRAAKLARIPRSALITGFSLPMILSFVAKRDAVPFDELAAILETDGKRGVTSEMI